MAITAGKKSYTKAQTEELLAVLEKNRGLVFSVAYKRLGSYEDAEDVLMQVQEFAFENLPVILRLDEDQQRWLLADIAKKRSVDLYRSNQIRNHEPLESAAQLETPEDDALSVRNAFDRLLQDERDLLMYRFELGLTAEEIARVLGKKKGAVQKGISRAKDALKKALKEEGIDV